MTPYDILRFFAYDHLPGHLQAVSRPFCDLAHQMAALAPEYAEGDSLMFHLHRDPTQGDIVFASIDGAPQGARDHAAYRIAVKLAVGLALNDAEAAPIICDWADRCQPPFEHSQAIAKLSSARRSSKCAPGYMLKEAKKEEAYRVDLISFAGPKPENPHQTRAEKAREQLRNEPLRVPTQHPSSLSRSQRKSLALLASMVGGDKARRITRLAQCREAHVVHKCGDHGPQRIGVVACESPNCPYCAGSQARELAHHVRENWDRDNVAVIVDVASLEDDVFEKKPRLAHSRVRKRARKALRWDMPYRWVLGFRRQVWFLRGSQRHHAERIAEELDGRVERCNATRASVWIRRMRTERSKVIKDLVARKAWMDLAEHPLFDEPWYCTTASNDLGRNVFPWSNRADIRAKLIAEAIERRGGVPLDLCAEPGCGKKLAREAVATATGVVLHQDDGRGEEWRFRQKVLDCGLAHLMDNTPRPDIQRSTPLRS